MQREIEEESEASAPVVRSAEGQEAARRLPRTGSIRALEVKTLGDQLRIAYEVVWVRRIHQRAVTKRHRVTERQIAEALAQRSVAFRVGRRRGEQEQSDRREQCQESDPHPNHLRVTSTALGCSAPSRGSLNAEGRSRHDRFKPPAQAGLKAMTSPRESPTSTVSPLIAGPLKTAECRSCVQSTVPSRPDSATIPPAFGSPNTSPVPNTRTPLPIAGAEYTGRPVWLVHLVLPPAESSANMPEGSPAEGT